MSGVFAGSTGLTQQMLDDVFFNAESWLAGEVGTDVGERRSHHQPRVDAAGLPAQPAGVDPAADLTGTVVLTFNTGADKMNPASYAFAGAPSAGQITGLATDDRGNG